jgi:CheY-like chemotaxis protein
LNVLVVEDDSALRDIYADLLTMEGHDVALAEEGRQALSLMRDSFDLVITDLNMPGMSGATFLDQLRRDARFKTLPVLVITALPNMLPADLQGPWTSVIRKPFHVDQLARYVKAVAARTTTH